MSAVVAMPIEEQALANVEQEAALLGALMNTAGVGMIDPVADIITADDFFEPLHGRIFSAILQLHGEGKPANPVTLKPYFDADPAMQEVGASYLVTILGDQFAPMQVLGARHFAQDIADLARRRRLVGDMLSVVEEARKHDLSTPELIAKAETAVAEASRHADDGTIEMSLAKAMSDALEGESHEAGVTCGIEPIDKALGPIHPKEMVVIAGRPGMGKTIVGLSYALGVVKARESLDFDGVRDAVLFVSLEMSARQLGQRAAADLCFDGHRGVYYGDIVDRNLSNEQAREVARAINRVDQVPLQIVDAPRMTVGRLGSTVRRWKRRFAARNQQLRLVVVDYLQLLQPDNREKDLYTRITEVSKGIKAVAKANDVPIIALAQLSRQVETRTGSGNRPGLGDLRDSGQIEQDADGVCFLYRAEYYLKKDERADETHPKHEAWEAAMNAVRGQIEYIVAKRRERPESTTKGRFYGSFQAVR